MARWIAICLLFILLTETRINAESAESREEEAIAIAIEQFEHKMELAVNAEQERLFSEGEIHQLHNDAIFAIEKLTKLMDKAANVNSFIKIKAVYSLLMPKFPKCKELTARLLILTKTLFESARATTASSMPIKFVDRLLEIFDSNAHMALKVHSLDILAEWLPGNPKVQARVMKLKGLEPFYKQIHKFDSSTVRKMLFLLNDILTEHVAARMGDAQNTGDSQRLNVYMKIGLVERVNTPTFCDGLLNIFDNVWSYSLSEDDVLLPVLELTKTVKPFCVQNFSDRAKALELFQDLKKHVIELKDKDNKIFDMGKLLEYDAVLKDYVDELMKAGVKDEF